MISLSFFEIPYGDGLAKDAKRQYVQVILRSMAEYTGYVISKEIFYVTYTFYSHQTIVLAFGSLMVKKVNVEM
jgi:hypothetical protein